LFQTKTFTLLLPQQTFIAGVLEKACARILNQGACRLAKAQILPFCTPTFERSHRLICSTLSSCLGNSWQDHLAHILQTIIFQICVLVQSEATSVAFG